jgi:hypothetical protein
MPGPKQASQQSMTVQQVIDLILATIQGAPFSKTVDTLKAGSASQTVTGHCLYHVCHDGRNSSAIAAGANLLLYTSQLSITIQMKPTG